MKSAFSFAAALCLAMSLFAFPRTMAAAGEAPILKIDVITPKGAGTMHYADELRLSIGDSPILTLKTNVGTGKLIPIPGPQYPIDESHVLLLGWSSYGGGMQTLHAMQVQVESGSVRLQGELILTAARTASPLIVRRNGPNELLVGIGEPGSRLFSERDWLLVIGPAGNERLHIGGIRKLPFFAEAKKDTDALYAPPMGSTQFPARIAWFSVGASGFAPLTGAR